MIIKTILASDSIETFQSNGLKRWRKYEITADLQEGENEFEVAQMLREKLQEFHNASNFEDIGKGDISLPDDYVAVGNVAIRKSQPERTAEVPKTREGRIEQMIKDISTCKDEITLSMYKTLAKTYPEIQEAYDKKLKEFA